MPALVPTAGVFRALTVHDSVPAGHIAVPVTRSDWMPHLRPGEFAVLDPSDVEPQMGEIYGLTISSPHSPGGSVVKLVQPYRSQVCEGGITGTMFRFGLPGSEWGFYADGPLLPEWWRRKCRGRVVGVLQAVEADHA